MVCWTGVHVPGEERIGCQLDDLQVVRHVRGIPDFPFRQVPSWLQRPRSLEDVGHVIRDSHHDHGSRPGHVSYVWNRLIVDQLVMDQEPIHLRIHQTQTGQQTRQQVPLRDPMCGEHDHGIDPGLSGDDRDHGSLDRRILIQRCLKQIVLRQVPEG